jgi:hypothetical protein
MRQLSKQQLSKLKIRQQYLRLDKKIAEKEFFKYFNLIHNPSFAQTSVKTFSRLKKAARKSKETNTFSKGRELN